MKVPSVETIHDTPEHLVEGEDIVQTANQEGSENYSSKLIRQSGFDSLETQFVLFCFIQIFKGFRTNSIE